MELEGVLSGLPDGMLIANADGQIVFANPAMEQLTGYPVEDLRTMVVEELLPPPLRAAHEGHRAAYLASPRARRMGLGLDLWLRRRDGSLLPMDIALSPLPSSSGLLVIAAIRDESTRRQAERELREQGHLLEAAHDAFLARRVTDSRITFWNQGAVRTYGFSREEALGAVSHHLLLSAGAGSSGGARDEALLEGGRWEGTVVHTRRDGEEIVVESRQVLVPADNGQPATIFEVNRDVTEQYRDRNRLAGVLAVNRAILAEQDQDSVLGLTAHHARLLLHGKAGLVFIAGGDGESGVGVLDVDGLPGPVSGSATVEPSLADMLPDEGPRVLDRLTVRLSRRVLQGPAIAAPLACGHRPLGALAVLRPEGRPFGEPHRHAIRHFASGVAVAIDYGRLRAELRRLDLVKDRERIAGHLHDTVIRTVSGVTMHLQGAASWAQEPEVRARLETSVAELDQAISELRSLVFRLRPDSP